MVKGFLSSFNREISGVHQAALVLAFSGLATKILALVRDRMLAQVFGAGETLDVYFAAFRIPDFLYNTLFLLLTTGAALMPIFFSRLQGGHEKARVFLDRISTLFWIFSLLIVFVAFFAIPLVSPWIAPGFSEKALADYVSASRVLLLSALLLGFSAFVSSVIQAYNRFFIYAISPLVYNVGIIAGILSFPWLGFNGLLWGVVLGAALHLAVQIPSLVSLKLVPRFSLDFFHKDVFEVLKYSFPRAVSLGMSQVVLTALTAFASAIGAGSIAVFQFAYNLFNIPLSLIGVSYSIAAFPSFAKNHAEGQTAEFLNNVSLAIRNVVFLSMPSVALFIVLRAHVVRVVLGVGSFNWSDTRLTAALLALFAVSVVAQGVVLVFVRAFYAAGRTIFPLLVMAFTGILSILTAYVGLWVLEPGSLLQEFVASLMRVADVPRSEVVMLAAAFSLGNILAMAFLWAGFLWYFKNPNENLTKSLGEHILAAFVSGGSAYGVLHFTDGWFLLDTFWGVFGHGFLAGAAGLLAALSFLALIGNRELIEVSESLRTKLLRPKVVGPEPKSASEA